jgi:hypothetical protein
LILLQFFLKVECCNDSAFAAACAQKMLKKCNSQIRETESIDFFRINLSSLEIFHQGAILQSLRRCYENKLACLALENISNLVSGVEPHTVVLSKVFLLNLSTSVRPAGKHFQRTNTLAYFVPRSVTKGKSFVRMTTEM